MKIVKIARGRRGIVPAWLVLWLGFGLPGFLLAQPAQSRGAVTRNRAVSASKSAMTVLTQVRQVRELSTQQAGRSVPVRISGIVTAMPGWKNSFFVQDATAGISVDRTDHAEVHVGDLVDLTGVSNPGLFAPVVVASRVQVTGHSSPPPARRATYADMAGGAEDSQWIEVLGVVHSTRAAKLFGRDVLMLSLAVGGGSLSVTLQDIAGIDAGSLTDSTLLLRGVSSTSFNEKRQFVGLGLLVPERGGVKVIRAAVGDPFAAEVTPVRNLFQFGQAPHRLKVRGIATYQIPGRSLYIQDGNDGIMIQTGSKEVVRPGSIVDAVGFPVSGDYAPRIEDGVVHIAGMGKPVMPPRIQAKDVNSITGQPDVDQPPYDEQLVQLEGTVVESRAEGGQQAWTMRQGNQVFDAYMPVPVPAGRLKKVAIGSLLALTGICEVHLNSDHVPISFSLLVRTPDDVVVLKHASWWTTGHALLVIASLAFAIVLIVLWVVVLRHRVEQQTRVIRASELRFRGLAERDVLTGLPNRLMLEERIAKILARCKSDKMKAVIFTVDIDRFKQINDTYGHLAGDECLKIVAKRLQGVVRQVDTIARTGGEEFTIVVGGLTSSDNAKRVSADILDLFHNPIVLTDMELKITVSVGGALYPDDGTDSETLRMRSDQALYEAKRTGRSRALFATEALSESNDLSAAIESALREGLQLNSFSLLYQPIVDSTGKIRRFKALLRSRDKRLREFGPAHFIPIAEESGLIIPLGLWVIEAACRQILEWRKLGVYEHPIAVNISRKQLTYPGFAEQVVRTLKQFQIEPGMLELELTETSAMTQMVSAADSIANLASKGLAFAIDDFGTGYSSLSRLYELRIKAVTIDRSFIQLLEKNGGSSTIIKAIIQMAKSLGIQVVAEGVETGEQFSLLRELGCDYFQGYLFAEPLKADRVLEALRDNHPEMRLLPTAS